MSIYLDNSATTLLSPAAGDAMRLAWETYPGNPSSVYRIGYEAKTALEEARARILRLFGQRDASAGRIFFTSGGTESDNLSLYGVALAKNYHFRPRIITTASEHPAVLEPLALLEARGFDIVRLPCPGGVPDLDRLEAALTPETILLSMMLVNNETGALTDVKSCFSLAKRKVPGLVTHCDAVQGLGKVPCMPAKLGADLLAVSAHKLHGPRGIGALWVSSELLKAKKLVPAYRGGGQEDGFRSGTENLPAIMGFAAAAKEAAVGMEERTARLLTLRSHLLARLPADVRVNTPSGAYFPGIVSLTLPKIKSEVMVRALSGDEIYVSAGSACASHHRGVSHVLLDFGLPDAEADCTIRVSMDASDTEEELELFCEALERHVRSLQRIQ